MHVRDSHSATPAMRTSCWVAWLLGSFAATALYLLVASLQLAFVTRWGEARAGALGGPAES